jgi:TetR/AcrR family transcriptional repressor of mexCD-oprJ operon
MAETAVRQHQQAIAKRNADAILDAAERVLGRGEAASISAVAAEAGLSRVTVYAHYPDRQRLIEALVARAIGHATGAIEAADPDHGPADEALERVLAASWEAIGRNEEIARAAIARLSPDAMRRSHEAVRGRVRRVVDRGRKEGTFRTDVPAGWLVTAYFALVHAAREEMAAGELDAEAALAALRVTVRDLTLGGSRARPRSRAGR